MLVKNEDVLSACLHIREEVFVKEKGVPREMETDADDRLDGMPDHFLIQEENGTMIGTLRVRPLSETAIKIQRFCFLREYRGKGYGSAVIQALADYYRGHGVQTISADAKYTARLFYEKCGFAAVSDVFEEAGIPHIQMQMKL